VVASIAHGSNDWKYKSGEAQSRYSQSNVKFFAAKFVETQANIFQNSQL
jgi:hypothetical protein